MSVTHAGSRRSPCNTHIAAAFLLCALIGAPALAANSVEAGCDNDADIALQSPANELNARVVSGQDLDVHHDSRALSAPQSDKPLTVRLAPRQAVKTPLNQPDDRPAALTGPSVGAINGLLPNLRSEQQETRPLDASIPGVTHEELQRFKKQMYRKDI